MMFGASDLRLTPVQWLVALLILVPLLGGAPWLWTHLERFDTGPNYRLPYDLSRDYWLYQRRLRQTVAPTDVLLMGDSVIWGEYVLRNGTLSSFLNSEQQPGGRFHFINAGVNGMFPLALEGLARNYASIPSGQKVFLNCNLLWMTSPQADLSSSKQEHFNHSRLVPQFYPRIPCYRADAAERVGAWIQNQLPLLGWVNHLQDAYFNQKSLPGWTLSDDGGDPPNYPNSWRNPFAQISWVVPSEPAIDPQRGPDSPRHRPWSTQPQGNTQFEWVALDASLQWAAFQRLTLAFRDRGNPLFVMVGPFNEHMLARDNLPACRTLRDGISAWLTANNIPHWTPDPLPGELYADASHPLTDGYRRLARALTADAGFQSWLNH